MKASNVPYADALLTAKADIPDVEAALKEADLENDMVDLIVVTDICEAGANHVARVRLPIEVGRMIMAFVPRLIDDELTSIGVEQD